MSLASAAECRDGQVQVVYIDMTMFLYSCIIEHTARPYLTPERQHLDTPSPPTSHIFTLVPPAPLRQVCPQLSSVHLHLQIPQSTPTPAGRLAVLSKLPPSSKLRMPRPTLPTCTPTRTSNRIRHGLSISRRQLSRLRLLPTHQTVIHDIPLEQRIFLVVLVVISMVRVVPCIPPSSGRLAPLAVAALGTVSLSAGSRRDERVEAARRGDGGEMLRLGRMDRADRRARHGRQRVSGRVSR